MSPWIIVGIIVGGILLLYGLLLVVRARVTIEYRDEFSLTLWLFGIPIRILPRKERKKKYTKFFPIIKEISPNLIRAYHKRSIILSFFRIKLFCI